MPSSSLRDFTISGYPLLGDANWRRPGPGRQGAVLHDASQGTGHEELFELFLRSKSGCALFWIQGRECSSILSGEFLGVHGNSLVIRTSLTYLSLVANMANMANYAKTLK